VDVHLAVVLHGAGNRDTDAEDPATVALELCAQAIHGGCGALDDLGWVAVLRNDPKLRARELGHRQVERLYPHPGLADVDADHTPELRVHPQEDPRATAVRLLGPDLDDEPLLEKGAHDIRDARAAQARQAGEANAVLRPPEEQRPQHRGPVDAPEVPHRWPHGRHVVDNLTQALY